MEKLTNFKTFRNVEKNNIIYLLVRRTIKPAKVIGTLFNHKLQKQVIACEEYIKPGVYGNEIHFRAYPDDSMWNNNAFIAFTTRAEAERYLATL